MPSQNVRVRKQGQVDFASNNVESLELSRGMIYRELLLTLKQTPTLSAANNTAAKTARGDGWGVIKRIRLIANGTDVLVDMSGLALWWMNYYLYGKAPLPPLPDHATGATAAVQVGDATTANPVMRQHLILPLWMPRSLRPIDTALDARILSDLQIEIDWGTFTDVNTSATAWTTEPLLEVRSLESFGLSRDSRFAQWRRFAIETTFTASSSEFQIDLPVGQVYRGFLINLTDAGVDAGDMLNEIRLRSGTTDFFVYEAESLRAWHHIRMGLSRGFSGTALDDLAIADPSNADGWYYIDLVTDGMLSEAIDSFGFSELKLVCDLTVGAGASKITVWPQQLVPIRG